MQPIKSVLLETVGVLIAGPLFHQHLRRRLHGHRQIGKTPMQDITIIGADGVRRRARKGEILQEGERIHFPATLMDAMASVMADATAPDRIVRDGYGTPAGHRPGYAFAANDAQPARSRDTSLRGALRNACKMRGATANDNMSKSR